MEKETAAPPTTGNVFPLMCGWIKFNQTNQDQQNGPKCIQVFQERFDYVLQFLETILFTMSDTEKKCEEMRKICQTQLIIKIYTKCQNKQINKTYGIQNYEEKKINCSQKF